MEADLDLADSLKASEEEFSGDELMLEQYSSQRTNQSVAKPYNKLLYASSTHDFKSKSVIDPVLHRPTTPGQLRQSIVAFTVDSLANSLAVGELFQNQGNGHQPLFTATSTTSFMSKKSLSASIVPASKSKSSVKLTKTSMSISRPKSNNRLSSTDQSKQLTPVLAFGSNDALDRSVPTLTPPSKVTPPMKFSFAEPPRSNSSASIRSSSSSTLDSSHGTVNNSKTKKN